MATSATAPTSPIRWLHVPKSGSAFINLAARYGCEAPLPAFDIALNFTQYRREHPELRCPGLLSPWAGHTPVRSHELGGNSRVLVGVFRKPAQRLLSGFHHREEGKPQMMIAPGAPPGSRANMRRACRDDTPRGGAGCYARWPGIPGCATKMLLGHQCASTHPITDADVAKAVRIVKEGFAYVGLLEHWATSVCLFHATFRGGAGRRRRQSSTADNVELRLTHPGPLRAKHAGDAARGSFTYDEKALRGFVDEADERVYKAASERFWADARRAGCAAASQSQDLRRRARRGRT